MRLGCETRGSGEAHALFEVPQVHRSISAKGEGDLSVSKPRFIRHLLERFGKPVLYVDSDVVFRRRPGNVLSQVKGPVSAPGRIRRMAGKDVEVRAGLQTGG